MWRLKPFEQKASQHLKYFECTFLLVVRDLTRIEDSRITDFQGWVTRPCTPEVEKM